MRQGEYVKAEKLYKKSLKIYEKVFGENHSYMANNYNNLGLLYEGQGEDGKALACYFKAYKIVVDKNPLNSLDMQIAYKNMERVYSKRNLKCTFKRWLNRRIRELL